ncbi:MAG TPA: hypothetical protein VL947_07030 [Cytophagales bacterium]|nr:hypothetical protein [Cytophagales bacterium]
MGTKVRYQYRNNKFQISWGDASYSRVYDSLYACDYKDNVLYDFVPKYNSETKNHLVFTNILWTSSGSNLAPIELYAIIFPKNIDGNILEKEFFIKSEGDYLIYGDPEPINIHLMNVETQKHQTIELTPKLGLSRSPTSSILMTQIKEKMFYIKYESFDKSDNTKIIERIYKIKI